MGDANPQPSVYVAIANTYDVTIVGKLQHISQLVGATSRWSFIESDQDTDQRSWWEGEIIAIEYGMIVEQAVGQIIRKIYHNFGGSQRFGGYHMREMFQFQMWQRSRWHRGMGITTGPKLFMIDLYVMGVAVARQCHSTEQPETQPASPGQGAQPYRGHTRSFDLVQ